MKKLLVFISGLLFTLTATSFAGNIPSKQEPVKAKSSCCECPCGDNCSPGACPANCGCKCDK